jgi:hypothetical protein
MMLLFFRTAGGVCARAMLCSVDIRAWPGSADGGAPAEIALPQLVEFRAANTAAPWYWIARAQNLVLEYMTLAPGQAHTSPADPDESALFTLDDDADVTVTWQEQVTRGHGRYLIVVPAGVSSVTADSLTRVVRLSTTAVTERRDAAVNAADYAEPHPGVAPLSLWPEPAGEPRVRSYRLTDYPPSPDRFGAIFRTRAFMVNFLPPTVGPRDPDKLSPHAHDDFEQVSLVTAGEYVHHIRTPWTARSSTWVDDIHWHTTAPSITIIPPPTVHTSQATADAVNTLIDIFSPPRRDFSQRPGWVLNAADYPAP